MAALAGDFLGDERAAFRGYLQRASVVIRLPIYKRRPQEALLSARLCSFYISRRFCHVASAEASLKMVDAVYWRFCLNSRRPSARVAETIDALPSRRRYRGLHVAWRA